MFLINNIIFGIQLLVLRMSFASANERCPEESLKLKCYNQEADNIFFPNVAKTKHKISTAARWEILKASNCKTDISTKFSFGDSSFSDLRKTSRGYGFFDKLSFSNEISKGWIKVEAYGDDKQLLQSFKCPVLVTAEEPIAKILGGSKKILEAGKDAECDGSQSVDKNNPLKKTQSLSFQWDCQLEPDTGFAKGFCRSGVNEPKYQEPVFKIPKHFAENGAVFFITLKVRSTLNINSPEVTAKQKITFLADAAVLNIQCDKNCPDVNPSKPVMLKVNCQTNCQDISYKWSMQTGKRNIVLVGNKETTVTENKMLRGHAYIFRVQTKGADTPKGLAEVEFEIPKPPVLKDCKVDPQDGKAHVTQFRLQCDWYPRISDEKLTAEIYSVNKGQKTLMKTLSGKGIDLDTAVFTLAESTEVEVVLRDVHGGESSQQAPVYVKGEPPKTTPTTIPTTTPTISSTTTQGGDIETKVEEILKNAEKETDPDKILQLMDVLSEDLKDLPQDQALDHAIRALEIMNKMVHESVTEDQLIRANELANKISYQFMDNPNPDVVSTATDLCKESATLVLDKVTESDNKEEFRDKAEKNAEALVNCSVLGLKNNTEILEPKNLTDPYEKFNITTNATSQFDMESVPQKIEYYPDYVDDENATDALAKFEKASANMIKICFINAKTLAMTLIPEESDLRKEVQDLVVIAKRKYGRDLMGSSLSGKNVTIVHSKDFGEEPERVIDVLMCVTDHNPLWWTKEKIASQVAVIQYQKRIPRNENKLKNLNKNQRKHAKTVDRTEYDEVQIKDFKNPFKINFKIDKTTHLEDVLKIHEAVLPKESVNDLSERSFYEKVSVYRIFVAARQNFKVEFKNVTENDFFDVLITNFQTASYEKFKSNSIEISKDNSNIDLTHDFSYDSFYFLSVLPSKKMKQTKERYDFSVYTFACFFWNEKNKKWNFGCKGTPKSNSTLLECVCKIGGGTLAGLLQNNRVNFVQNLIISFRLPLTICWVIFLTVAVSIGLYCIILCFVVFETKEEILDKVYFLSDVPSFYKYAYLIIVKTGNKKHAGTTSNVSIKLHGDKAESMEHVLNYPDKEGRILNKNQEDWFIMGTENYLGDIKKVEFWFDSVGENPSWYCVNLQLYDIQKDKSYFIHVEDCLNILKDNKTSYVVTPTKEGEFLKRKIVNDKEKSRQRQKIDKILGFFHDVVHSKGNHMWNIWKKDCNLFKKEKLTLILSVIMSFFTLEMFLYNCPNFDNSDSIDSNDFGPDYQLIWIPLVGSVITFICHFPVIYAIKRRNAKIIIQSEERDVDKLHGYWILVFFNIFFCVTFLTVFGFWIPWNTSYLWLVSVILSMLFYALILENISCLIYGNVLKINCYTESFTEKISNALKFAELQRKWIYKRFGTLALRPYFSHLYSRLNDFTVKDRKNWEAVKSRTLEILEDLIMIVIYVALLYTIILIDKEEYTVNSHLHVKTLSKGSRLWWQIFTIDRINSLPLLKRFLTNHLVFYLQDTNVTGTTSDLVNHYLGVIRLRQHRASFEPCDYPTQMHFLNMTCRHNFISSPDSRSFGEGWLLNNTATTASNRLGKVWLYNSAKEAGTSPYLGKIALYPGGGYIAPLGRTQKNSLTNLDYLFKKNWIDLLTRALFIECLLYNPNSNIFNAVQLVFEISATGHVARRIEIQTRKFIFLKSEIDLLTKVVYLSFFIVLLIITLKILSRIFIKRKMILKDVWSLVDVVIIILSFGVIYLYIFRMNRVNAYLKQLSNSKYNEFVNYFHLFAADNLLYSFAAALVFIGTLRLWKLMRFLLMIKIAERTLKKSAIPLLILCFYQAVYTVGFGACGMMLFGEESDDFKSVEDTVTTLLLLSVNLMEKEDVEVIESSGVIGEIFYSLYMIFSLFVVTLYIAIVTVYYMEANEFYANERGEFQKYLKLKIGYYYTVLKVKIRNLRGGQGKEFQDKFLPPKDDQYRYARCLTISENKLESMALITRCVLRNQTSTGSKLTESDIELMRATVASLSRKQSREKELFFISSATKSKVGLVDDRKLLQIDEVLEKLMRHQLTSKGQAKKTVFDQRAERIDLMIKNIEVLVRLLENVSVVLE